VNIRIGILAVAALAGVAQANVDWVDWQSATSTSVTGVANGINVTYSGGFQFAQTNGGTNYWNNSATYVSATVPNAPPDSDIIALATVGGTLSFSQAVTDPIMAIVSLGRPNTGSKWHFDAPFQIVSQGAGYFGSGPLTNPSGNTLQGNEGHGVIQFKGTFSSISWQVTNGEDWAGFTVAVPAPGSAAAIVAGLLPALRRRRR
jgi:hypothetical protein